MSNHSATGHFTFLTLVNGQWTDSLPVRDRGLAYGDGLFETCRWHNGQVPLWPWHRQRLLADARKLYLPITEERLEQDFLQFSLRLNQRQEVAGTLKLIITRGEGGNGVVPAASPQPTFIWQFMPITPCQEQADKGVRLLVAEHRLSANTALAGIKHLNRLDYVLATARQPPAATEQLLLLDTDGHPVETHHHNIFWIKNRQLFTPSLQQVGVCGVMRRWLADHVAAASLEWVEGRFALADLYGADEVFIANALRGIWPVNQIDQTIWADWPITRQLQNLERVLWR